MTRTTWKRKHNPLLCYQLHGLGVPGMRPSRSGLCYTFPQPRHQANDTISVAHTVQVYLSINRADLARGRLPGLCTPRPLSDLVGAHSERLRPLCASCKANLAKAADTEMRKIFDRLPALVGVTVDGWQKQGGGAGASG